MVSHVAFISLMFLCAMSFKVQKVSSLIEEDILNGGYKQQMLTVYLKSVFTFIFGIFCEFSLFDNYLIRNVINVFINN